MNPSTSKLFWSASFFAIAVFCVVSCAIAPGNNWWLPPDFSTFGKKTDDLFNFILVITTVAFVGVQIFCLGLLGEYVGRIYSEVRRRPRYLIRRVIEGGDR